MYFNYFKFLFVLLSGVALACSGVEGSSKNTSAALISSQTAVESPSSTAKGVQTAIFAGGCFWGVEAVFEHIKGVSDVTSGYTGGTAKTANYDAVSAGKTGHAEAVKVTYDSSKVSYEQLLKVFFSVAHDPTELNRQGPDIGTQYRSAIFYSNEEQKRLAQSYIDKLNTEKAFAKPIVTQLAALGKFYRAENYHQNYLALHPKEPYIVMHDQPKVENLRKQFPDLFVAK
jgi:peptide-methionine (S)-S-oxide reductase